MKNAMIGGLTVLFATGYILAHSASAQPLTPLANHQSGAVNLVGWGDNGQGGGYGGTPQTRVAAAAAAMAAANSRTIAVAVTAAATTIAAARAVPTTTIAAAKAAPIRVRAVRAGMAATTTAAATTATTAAATTAAADSGNNGSSGTSGNTSGGNKAKQAVCLGRCHKDCQLDAIANHKPGPVPLYPKCASMVASRGACNSTSSLRRLTPGPNEGGLSPSG